MAFVDQDPNKNFPPNPVTFQPFGDKFFNEETKKLNETLLEILEALGGSEGATKGVDNMEQITCGTGVNESPTFAPSFFTVVNPSTNDDDIEVTIITRDGDKSINVSPGETFSPPYIPGLTYNVDALINAGTIECEYFALQIGTA